MLFQQWGQNTSDDEPNIQQTSGWITNEYVTVILICIYVPFIVCSNALVVIAVLKFKRLQIPANYFVLSLSLADIFVALTLPVYVRAELTSDDSFCNMFNLAANRVLMTAAAVSVITLAIVACDRYIAIAYSLEYVRIMTKQKIWASVMFSYIYGIVMTLAPVFGGWYSVGAERTSLCFGDMFNDKARIVFVTTVFLPSCACVIFCYLKIAVIARHHARAIAVVENNFRERIERKFFHADRKYAKTLAIVISIFVLLWTPYLVLLLIQMTCETQFNAWVKHYLMLLAFANSGLNPWVYAYKNTDFRSAFLKLVPACRFNNRVTPIHRRSSGVSQISVLPSSGNLDRSNSRIVDSDILYVLRKHNSDACEQTIV